MKKKSSLLSLGLIALVLVLGVGYAVVQEVDLTISGTASVKGSTLAVYFNGETSKEDATNGKVTATATNKTLAANITVTDLTLNETVTATYTVVSEETDVAAKISKESITVLDTATKKKDLSSYFEVSTDVDTTPKTLAAGGETTVTVTVKLIKTPVEEADSKGDITVNLLVEPAA